MGQITAPVLLTTEHDVNQFCCGNETLDSWLIKRGLKNQDSGASKTFVITEGGSEVIGYYALTTGSIERAMTSGNFSRQMPDPIPVIILDRLAIHQKYQGKKLGAALLKDTIQRTLIVADNVGVRGLLVHALSDEAKQFYLKYGFVESPMEPMTLMISLKNLRNHL